MVEICEMCCVVQHIVEFNKFQVFSNYWLQFPYTSVRSNYTKELFESPKFIFAFFLGEPTIEKVRLKIYQFLFEILFCVQDTVR